MDILTYFNPVSIQKPDVYYLEDKHTFCHAIDIHTENNKPSNLSKYQIALLSVNSGLHTENYTDNPSNYIREKLYQLVGFAGKPLIVDLGTIKPCKTLNDTILGLRDVIIELYSKNIIPIVIGNEHLLTYSFYLSYKAILPKFNFTTVDAKLDINSPQDKEINSDNYLYHILNDKKNNEGKLFHYSNVGNQVFYTPKEFIQEINHFNYESIRLGQARERLDLIEPILRDSNFVSIDINSIRQLEAPGNKRPSPNGFYGEEICQLSRYAGVSDSLTLFGVFEYNPIYDNNKQTAHLIAQMIWYFIDGYNSKIKESDKNKSCKKFIVKINGCSNDEIVFFKSKFTDKWWMEVADSQSVRKEMIACSYDDYQKACNNEVPDKWLNTFCKLN